MLAMVAMTRRTKKDGERAGSFLAGEIERSWIVGCCLGVGCVMVERERDERVDGQMGLGGGKGVGALVVQKQEWAGVGAAAVRNERGGNWVDLTFTGVGSQALRTTTCTTVLPEKNTGRNGIWASPPQVPITRTVLLVEVTRPSHPGKVDHSWRSVVRKCLLPAHQIC